MGGEREGGFAELRERWRALVRRERGNGSGSGSGNGHGNGRDSDGGTEVGCESAGEVVWSENLRCGQEAQDLRRECALRVRNEVLKVRRRRGLPDEEDTKAGLTETWKEEGPERGRRMDAGSWTKDA